MKDAHSNSPLKSDSTATSLPINGGLKQRRISESEQDVIDLVYDQDMRSVNIVFDEVKRTFDAQQKRIDALTQRTTWLVATSFVVVVAVVGRSGDIQKAFSEGLIDDWQIWVIAICTMAPVTGALFGIWAAIPREYWESIKIDALQTEYQWWDETHAKIQWIAQYRDMFEVNETQLKRHVRYLQFAFRVIMVSAVLLVAVALFSLGQILNRI